jgi:hypothetical protein
MFSQKGTHMAQTITPQEFLLLADNPVIRTRCPHELVTDEAVLKRIRNGNLAVGDRVLVQCLDATGERLLAECEYRVTERRSAIKTVEVNDNVTRQFEDIAYGQIAVTNALEHHIVGDEFLRALGPNHGIVAQKHELLGGDGLH